MKVALFLTTEPGPAAALAAQVRAEHPGAAVSAFVRDDDRQGLAAALAGCDVRRDKPAGGKVAFVRALRRERFDLAVVAWHGGERLQPLRLVALLAARSVIAVDEQGRRMRVAWYRPWTWAAHALRRLLGMKATTVAAGLAWLYRYTLGGLIGGLLLLGYAVRRGLSAGPRSDGPRARN